MKILWSSNGLHSHTGYGNQSKVMIPRLCSLGHEVAMFAWYGLEGGSLNTTVQHGATSYSVPMYPKNRDGYGNDIVAAHAAHFKADIVITLIDAWVLDAERHSLGGVRFCPWAPIDMEPIPPPVLTTLRKAFRPIVYSKFGQEQAERAGLDVAYVPHGVETDVFCPGDKGEARAALGWPTDRFIVGMVAANKGFPSRKSYPEQLKAFARFAEKHSDALLYLHTNTGKDDGMGGVNLPELIDSLGIASKVIFPDPYSYIMGGPDSHMVNLYRAMDVLAAPSMGEGFGIPILESQACGTPVYVGDWTSMSELCFGGYLLPKPGVFVSDYGFIDQDFYTPLAANQIMPSIGHIIEALEWAYRNKDNAALSAAARAGALAYDADTVARLYWQPVLEDIEARINGAVSLEQTFSRLVKVAA